MKTNNYNGKKNNPIPGIISEILLSLAIIILVGYFAYLTLDGAPTQEEIKNISSNIQSIEESINDPSNWHILDVSSDWTEAKVLVSNGEVHLYTVYAVTDETVILNINGDLHSFNWSRG